MLALVAGDPGLEERVERQHREQDARQDHRRDHDVPGDRPAEDHRLPVGHHAQRTVEEADVPVGLGASRHLIGRERSEQPDRVDRDQAAHEGDDAEHDEEEAARLRHVHRQQRVAHDVVVGAARAGELGVLLRPDEHEVDRDQGEDQARDQQDVDAVEA